jgi:predicted NAD/FAD-binding protein
VSGATHHTSSGRRLAVIGGGMGGVSAAYLCDPEWTIDLFESRATLGGNASTIRVPDDGEQVPVDIGAESFNPGTHPWYWSLLHEIGAIDTVKPADDVRITMPGKLAVFDAMTKQSLFVSSHALRTPRYAISFGRFARAAQRFVADDPAFEVTVGEWVDGLHIDPTFRRDVLLPWLASLTCCSVEMVRTQSALAFLLLFVHVFPKGLFERPKTYCSRIGLGGILQMMIDRCEHVTVHTGQAVTTAERVDGSWYVETASGRHGPYEHVVVNAPPHASRSFLASQPTELLDVLARHTYYTARMVIHGDAAYMPANRGDWCSHNAAVLGDSCEATIWLGAFRTNPRTGRPVQLFKSWASNRPVQPTDVLAEQTFLHPSLSPDTLRATQELTPWQGRDGLHFVGHFTTITDLQETALASGMAVAKAISPTSRTLLTLERRLAAAGQTDVSYAVGAATTASVRSSIG